jgi:hypothetical protein
VRRWILGLKIDSSAERRSNRFERSAGSLGAGARSLSATWRRDRALLAREHGEVLNAVGQLHPSALDRKCKGSHTWRSMIAGAAFHDVYHAGQIQLLKKLAGKQ